MMELKTNKLEAIARLQSGDSARAIAEDLEIPLPIVTEWKDTLSPAELIVSEMNVIAIDKAYKMMLENPRSEEELKTALVSVAVMIAEKVARQMLDEGYDANHAKALNLSADTIAKLYNSIFAKGIQVGVMTNGDASKTEVNIFAGTLRA